eukprot:scaffold29819_cov31-Tisochrysis_lutea.AAC.6
MEDGTSLTEVMKDALRLHENGRQYEEIHHEKWNYHEWKDKDKVDFDRVFLGNSLDTLHLLLFDLINLIDTININETNRSLGFADDTYQPENLFLYFCFPYEIKQYVESVAYPPPWTKEELMLAFDQSEFPERYVYIHCMSILSLAHEAMAFFLQRNAKHGSYRPMNRMKCLFLSRFLNHSLIKDLQKVMDLQDDSALRELLPRFDPFIRNYNSGFGLWCMSNREFWSHDPTIYGDAFIPVLRPRLTSQPNTMKTVKRTKPTIKPVKRPENATEEATHHIKQKGYVNESQQRKEIVAQLIKFGKCEDDARRLCSNVRIVEKIRKQGVYVNRPYYRFYYDGRMSKSLVDVVRRCCQ